MESDKRKRVLHVASLAKLKLTDEEVEKYASDFENLMKEIDRIQEVDVDGEIAISSSTNKNKYTEDEVGKMLSREEILKNANKKYGSYIAVTRALND